MRERSDIDLFESIKEGDKEALSTLFLRYFDYLSNYGMQISKDSEIVEECIQELFIYIFESYDRLGNVTYVKAYLFRAIRRRIIEKLNKERQVRKTDWELAHLSNIEFSTDDFLIQNEEANYLRQTLAEALNKLPWRQREAIYLRYYNGLKTKEIAEIMGVANQTILNTLYQALKKIRKNKQLKKLFGFSTIFLPFLG